MDHARHGYGTRTGLLVHEAFRRRRPQGPALLYTHARDDGLLNRFQRPPLEQAFRKSKVEDEGVLSWAADPSWLPAPG